MSHTCIPCVKLEVRRSFCTQPVELLGHLMHMPALKRRGAVVEHESLQPEQQLPRQLVSTQWTLGGCVLQLAHQLLKCDVARQDVGDPTEDEQTPRNFRTGRGRGEDHTAAVM